MNNKNITIQINYKRRYPIMVFCRYSENPENHDILDGEFDFDHINYLWGMLQKYADIENINVQDLKITIHDVNKRSVNDSLLPNTPEGKRRTMILKTPDGKNWVDVPKRFKFVK